MNIDEVIYTAVFSSDDSQKSQARAQIRSIALEKGIIPSSIHSLYRAIGRGEVKGLALSAANGFTVPAINIKTLTYDVARVLFQLIIQKNIGALIFEIARSEIEYSFQRPEEFTLAVLAAAIKEDYTGPVSIQGDHYQFNKSKFQTSADEETNRIKDLVKESIEAQFYNIDIDASTLVDLSKENLSEQQKTNYECTAQLTEFIRGIEPEGVTVSVGGEIGHIGGKNSTVEDFEAFMQGYTPLVKGEGMSKVSVQTGTTHGGIPLPDGTIADVGIDFSVLQSIGKVAREKYRMGGAVQHGGSTLAENLLAKFPEVGTLEIHMGTAFMGPVFDHIPQSLRDEMFAWVKENLQDEREEGWTDEQFIYRSRKKALGPFKEKLWKLTEEEKKPILEGNKKQFALLIDKLKVADTREIVEKYV